MLNSILLTGSVRPSDRPTVVDYGVLRSTAWPGGEGKTEESVFRRVRMDMKNFRKKLEERKKADVYHQLKRVLLLF